MFQCDYWKLNQGTLLNMQNKIFDVWFSKAGEEIWVQGKVHGQVPGNGTSLVLMPIPDHALNSSGWYCAYLEEQPGQIFFLCQHIENSLWNEFVNPGDGVADGGRPGHLSWDRPTDGVGDLTGSLDGPNLTCQMGWPPTRGSARAAYPAQQKASASGSASASPLAIRWLARPTPYPRTWTPPATPTHQQQHWQ